MNKLEALEGADHRHQGSFLKSKDDAKVLGNLYRTVTSERHVKWVCLDHYRETYRASALKEFRNNLEANNRQYDDRCGRVTIKLSSTLLSQQLYNVLANTRFVQELFISLAWDTSMEDFRILKNVVQRSIIYHLDIDACGFSGSTFDFVNRGRRWGPVLQMMGNGKLGIVAVRNMPGFILRSGKIPGTLQIRVLDMSDQLTSTEEYPRLRKILLVLPNLQLSALLLKRQDGSMVTVTYRKGSGEVTKIELSICTNEDRKIFQLPMVTALSLFGDSAQNTDHHPDGVESRDIVVASHNLPVTDIDFDAYVVPVKSFDALGSLLSACVQFETLAFISPSLTYGIELVRGISALRGTLRNLTVRQPNWSRADALFVPGAEEVESIELRIFDVESPKLLALPCIKKVSIFSKNRNSKSTMARDFVFQIHNIISSYPDLETLVLLDMDTESKETIKAFIQTVEDVSVSQGPSLSDSQPEAQDVQVRKPSPRLLVDLPEEYVVIGNAFKAVRWITTMPLIISSADMSATPANDSLLSSSPTFAGDTQLMNDLIPAASERCHDLVTLTVVFLYQNMTYPYFLKMLGIVHKAAIQRPTLLVFKNWGLVNGNRIATFDIPVTYLDTT
ncbi:hypothetical protein BGX24_005963 [Mortierella sp. AD032]|nr:hypothetical protein BGX24_005963 [Mortierella sp. AD032]